MSRGNWIQTYTGKKFYPGDPRVEDVDIVDIARALSMICRFTGHVNRFYSVAQHAVLGSRQVPKEFRLEFLHHDDPEGYINDLATPFKSMLPDYQGFEHKVEFVCAAKWNLPLPMSPEVKEADARMVVTEASQLCAHGEDNWWENPRFPKPYDITIWSWNPEVAEREYLKAHEEYMSY